MTRSSPAISGGQAPTHSRAHAAETARLAASGLGPLLRNRPTQPNMELFRAKHVTITSDRRQPRELDGDLIEPCDTPDSRHPTQRAVDVRPAGLRDSHPAFKQPDESRGGA